jgi:hypothetical protein
MAMQKRTSEQDVATPSGAADRLRGGPSVWDAEHGASAPDPEHVDEDEEPTGSNVVHNLAIHGRLSPEAEAEAEARNLRERAEEERAYRGL